MPPAELAFRIMKTWKREKRGAATSEELRRVLRDKLKKVNTVDRVWPVVRSAVSVVTADPPSRSALPLLEAVPNTTQGGSCNQVAETTVMDIALGFSARYDCAQLAVFLEISQGPGFLDNSSPHTTNSEKAFDIMMEWKKEKGSAATGEWLYEVLRNTLNMKDLAEKFENVLLAANFAE